jgi:hypothetical protein
MIRNMTSDTQNELQEINKSLMIILKRIDTIEKSTSNMDRHIGFVERIYQHIKQPFHYLIGMVSDIRLVDSQSTYLNRALAI